MKQNRIIKILIAVFVVLLAAIVVVGIWSNQKRESKKEEFNESQTTAEEASTEEDTKELPKVENTQQQVTKDSAFYLALSGLALETDVKSDETLSFMVKAAEEGNADAQYFAGEMFLQGIGTKQDIEKAAKYLKKAYDNGNEHAFAIYGKLCFMGDGLRQNYEQAYEAFYNISEPTPEVHCAMGIMNIYGMGVRPDYEQARNYLSAAEMDGDIIAKTAKQSIKNAVYKRKPSEAEKIISKKEIKIVDYSTKKSELTELVDTVYKKIMSQESYDRFIQELESISKMSPELVNKVAIFGNDNWIFFQNNADGTSYHDYVGDNAFSEKELTAIKKNLESQKQKAEEKGAKFILMIYPNKEIIYCDKMPSYITRESEVTRADKLVAYLRENSDIDIVYPKEQFMEQKDICQLYYTTDTHCNMLGCFLGLAELLKQEYGKSLILDVKNFDIHTTNYAGDISVMIGREDRYAVDTVYFLPSYKATEEDKVDSSMILIGDSFSDFLKIQSSYYFKSGVRHYMIMDYEYDYKKAYEAALSSGKADIIVWECAERNLERLK